MSSLVLDCSAPLAWCFEDEASGATDALLELVRDQGAIVPSLWPLEVCNALLQAERRGAIALSLKQPLGDRPNKKAYCARIGGLRLRPNPPYGFSPGQPEIRKKSAKEALGCGS